MAINFDSTTSLNSNTITDAVINPTLNSLVVVLNFGVMYNYTLAAGHAQLGSSKSLTNNSVGGVTLISGASALVGYSAGSSVDVVELTNNSFYDKNYGVSNALSNSRTQQLAGDVVNQVALTTSSTTGKLGKVVATGVVGGSATDITTTTLTIPQMNGETAECIIYKSSLRWLVGTNSGTIHEVDNLGNVWQTISLPDNPNAGRSGIITHNVYNLSYGNDTLVVSTSDGPLYVYNYSTQTMLSRTFPADQGTTLSAMASSTVMVSSVQNTGTVNMVAELDTSMSPPSYRSVMFLNSNLGVTAMGVNSTTSEGFAAKASSGANRIDFFSVVPRNTSQITSTLEYPSGTNVIGRIIRILDPGVGSTTVALDTPITNNATAFPVDKGQNIIEIGIIQSGVETLFDISRYET